MYPDRPSVFSQTNCINIVAPVEEAPEQGDSLFSFQAEERSTCSAFVVTGIPVVDCAAESVCCAVAKDTVDEHFFTQAPASLQERTADPRAWD